MTDSPTALNVDRIAALVAPVLREHGIQRAILFGSFATGRQSRRSDVDLILVKQTQQRYLDRFQGILAELQRAIPDRLVEALIYTPEELQRIADRTFIRRALEEGRVIYESG